MRPSSRLLSAQAGLCQAQTEASGRRQPFDYHLSFDKTEDPSCRTGFNSSCASA